MFLDAMFFRDPLHGIVVGDPVEGQFFVRFTDNGGNTWNRQPESPLRGAEGEACFAASGSNIWLDSGGRYFLVTGGSRSSLFTTRGTFTLPLNQGQASTGANSIGSWKGKRFAVVGGDFAHDHDTAGNCALSFDRGSTWLKPSSPPHGYRSCVSYFSANDLVCCGTTGVDISHDAGKHWTLLTSEGFHVCAASPSARTIFLAGAGGRVARLQL
jgi:photosystem II stability/assembly factor-like uncharacterized protein